ncbi:secreted aspartic protease 8 [Diutina catenulata]
MKLALLTLATYVAALPSQKRSDAKVLALDLNYVESAQPKLTTFSGGVESELEMGNIGTYRISLEIGSQRDPVNANLDTGSADFWIDQNLHDVSQSDDGKMLATTLNVGYELGGYVKGPMALDSVYLGNTKVSNVQFGVVNGNTFQSEDSILGVGRRGLEGTSEQYDNFPYSLKKDGLINRVAFSLYLNKRQSEKGNVLFGGIDHAKLDGPLVKLDSPVSRTPDATVILKSIKSGDYSKEFNTAFLLDSGYTLSVLPGEIVDELAKQYKGARAVNGMYEVDCDQDTSKTIEFAFEGITFKVPITQFMWKTYQFVHGDSCKMGAKKLDQDSRTLILGATFLQNAYVVFDWEENTISLAKAKYTDATDIKEIPAL